MKDPEKVRREREELERLQREGEMKLVIFGLVCELQYCVLRHNLHYRESSVTS